MSLGSPRALGGGLGGRGVLPCPGPQIKGPGNGVWAGSETREGVADQAQCLTPDPQALRCGAGTTQHLD